VLCLRAGWGVNESARFLEPHSLPSSRKRSFGYPELPAQWDQGPTTGGRAPPGAPEEHLAVSSPGAKRTCAPREASRTAT